MFILESGLTYIKHELGIRSKKKMKELSSHVLLKEACAFSKRNAPHPVLMQQLLLAVMFSDSVSCRGRSHFILECKPSNRICTDTCLKKQTTLQADFHIVGITADTLASKLLKEVHSLRTQQAFFFLNITQWRY